MDSVKRELEPIKDYYPLVYALLTRIGDGSTFITDIKLTDKGVKTIKAYDLDISCYKEREYRFQLPLLSGIGLIKHEWVVIEYIFTRCMEQSFGSQFREVLFCFLHAVYPKSVSLLSEKDLISGDETVKLIYGSDSRKLHWYRGLGRGLINLGIDSDEMVFSHLSQYSSSNMVEISCTVPQSYFNENSIRFNTQRDFLEEL